MNTKDITTAIAASDPELAQQVSPENIQKIVLSTLRVVAKAINAADQDAVLPVQGLGRFKVKSKADAEKKGRVILIPGAGQGGKGQKAGQGRKGGKKKKD